MKDLDVMVGELAALEVAAEGAENDRDFFIQAGPRFSLEAEDQANLARRIRVSMEKLEEQIRIKRGLTNKPG